MLTREAAEKALLRCWAWRWIIGRLGRHDARRKIGC